MDILECTSEQMLLMAVLEFEGENDCVLYRDNLYSERDGVYEMKINTPLLKQFKIFVCKHTCYRNNFVFSVEKDFETLEETTVRGFKSEKIALKAVDLFNRERPDYYIDPSNPIISVGSGKNKVFIPEMEDGIENFFWSFIRSSNLNKYVTCGRVK